MRERLIRFAVAAGLLLGAHPAGADPPPMEEPMPTLTNRTVSVNDVLALVDRNPDVALAFGVGWAGYLVAQAENGKYQDCLVVTRNIPVETLNRDLLKAVRLQDPVFGDEAFITRLIVAGKKLYCGWADINRPPEETGD